MRPTGSYASVLGQIYSIRHAFPSFSLVEWALKTSKVVGYTHSACATIVPRSYVSKLVIALSLKVHN